MKNLRLFFYIFIFCILNLAFISIVNVDDVVRLKNGSTIEGEVLKHKDGKPIVKDKKITIKVEHGLIKISLDEIEGGVKGIKKPVEVKTYKPPHEELKEKPKPEVTTLEKPGIKPPEKAKPEKINPLEEKPSEEPKPKKEVKPEGIEAQIDDIKQRLKSKSEKVRLEAIDELIKIKDKATYPVLVDALKNDCFEVGLKASSHLKKLHKKRGIKYEELKLLVDAFSNSTSFSRLRLITIISAIKDPKAIELLRNAYMKEENIKARSAIIRTFGSLKNKEATKIIRSKIISTEPQIRLVSVIVLGQLKDKKSIPLLIERLEDKDKKVRLEALNSLKKITKRDFGKKHSLWKCWWLQNKDKF